MNTTNFNKMRLIKVNRQWWFPTEEDEESEESTNDTADAPDNADSGAPNAEVGEDNAEGGANDGATGNTPMDIEDDTTEENDKNSEFTKVAQEILNKLEEISAE